MNETLITDLVAQQALDQLDELDRKMEGTLTRSRTAPVNLPEELRYQ